MNTFTILGTGKLGQAIAGLDEIEHQGFISAIIKAMVTPANKIKNY